jgi:hypothetical protein
LVKRTQGRPDALEEEKASYSKEVSLLGPTEYPGVLGGGGVRGGPKVLKKKAGKQLLTAR